MEIYADFFEPTQKLLRGVKKVHVVCCVTRGGPKYSMGVARATY